MGCTRKAMRVRSWPEQRRTESRSQRYEPATGARFRAGRLRTSDGCSRVWGRTATARSCAAIRRASEVKGVALLIVNHPDRPSDQWMWTPALQRERRIALQDRSTRFFGTDFSFEDLEERDVNQYDYRLLGEQTVGGAACWRIESVPTQKKTSQYTKSEVWIRKDTYAVAQIESYIKNDVVRRLTYSEFAEVQGIWTGRRLEMTDFRRESRTILTLDQLQYNIPLRKKLFGAGVRNL